MTQSLSTSRHQADNAVIDYTPSSAVTGGDPANPGGGIIGYADRDIAASEKGALSLEGIRRFKKDGTSGPTFAVGDTIIWDASAELAIQPALDTDGSADFACAICVEAAVTGQDYVLGIPIQMMDRYAAIRPFVSEFDGAGLAADSAAHVLIPAYMNRHGLLIYNYFGYVTEKPVGSSEDQMIVTIENTDGTDIGTLTTSATADEIGDLILGSVTVAKAAAGAAVAASVVAAGKGVQGIVTQVTDDATPSNEAGKLKVYILAIPLL